MNSPGLTNTVSHHLMFDIDGTLVQSQEFDTDCFVQAVFDECGIEVDSHWSDYEHITDAGLLREILAQDSHSKHTDIIISAIRKNFVNRIGRHLDTSPVMETPGAKQFLCALLERSDVQLSIATGGWFDSARLKLQSAGLWFPQIPMASSSDHYNRTQIMSIAANRAQAGQNCQHIYFGDGNWDREACDNLGYDFVLIGNALEHPVQFDDFTRTESILASIGLTTRNT